MNEPNTDTLAELHYADTDPEFDTDPVEAEDPEMWMDDPVTYYGLEDGE